MRHYVILDGHSQIYRAIFAPAPPLTAPDGSPTSGVFIFFRQLMSTLRALSPTHFAIALDGPRDELYRRKIFEGYKAKRKETDEAVKFQANAIQKLIRRVGCPVYKMKEWEADDLIATFVEKFANEKRLVTIVSRDKDLHQVLRPGVRMYDPQLDETITDTDALKHWSVDTRSQITQVQCLAGDTADNIPGAAGIGMKTAAKMIREYGSLGSVLEHKDTYPPAKAKGLNELDAALMLQLVTLRHDLDYPMPGKPLRFENFDVDNIRDDLKALGIRNLQMAV